MNDPYADGASTSDTSALDSPASSAPASPEGEGDVARAPSVPRARMGILIVRLVVLIGVVFASVGLLLVAETWLVYRAGHTVVGNATVKGRRSEERRVGKEC